MAKGGSRSPLLWWTRATCLADTTRYVWGINYGGFWMRSEGIERYTRPSVVEDITAANL